MELTGLISYILYTVIVGAVIYRYLTRKNNYWKNVGIPYVPPLPLLGTLRDNMKSPTQDIEIKRYKKYGRIYGVFEGRNPALVVGDPDLLRNIFVKDFQAFPIQRDLRVGDKVGDNMLQVLVGEDWKRVRTIVTPTFSTGKIKKMMDIILDSAKSLGQNFSEVSKDGKPVDVKRLFGAFTMDVIASCAFATKLNSHKDPENEFLVQARKFFSRNVPWRFILLLLFPKVARFFRIPVFAPEPVNFFRKVTLEIIEERKKTGQKRNDFLQLLMEAADRMDSTDESSKETDAEHDEEEKRAKEFGHEENNDEMFKKFYKNKSLSNDELVAQCVIFFLAGYETTASVLTFAAYEFALNPDIQEKLISEIDEAVKKNEGKLTYEALQGMSYLDCVVAETLRKYPPAINIQRLAAEDYKLGDTGLTVPKGMIIKIPAYAIHHDPEYYPDPEKYDPERFTAEEKAKRHPYTYMPFGGGPRNCVAMRFALMELKVCLSYTMSQFRFKKCSETKVPPEYFPGATLLSTKSMALQVEARKDKVMNL